MRVSNESKESERERVGKERVSERATSGQRDGHGESERERTPPTYFPETGQTTRQMESSPQNRDRQSGKTNVKRNPETK